MKNVVILTAFGLASCTAASAPPARAIIGWRLVERPARELTDRGLGGDATLDPNSPVMVFEPVYEDELPVVTRSGGRTGRTVEARVTTDPSRPAPGEVVTATVRVTHPGEGVRYEITAEPTRDGISILGSSTVIVSAGEPGVIRFTSRCQGAGGVVIRAFELR